MKSSALIFAALAASLPIASHAAVGAAPTTGVATLSLKVAVPIVATGGGVAAAGINKGSWLGTLGGVVIGAGGVALGIVDPDAATFYSGSFTFHYDSDLVKLNNSGWLGDWGTDASLAAPPADPNLWDGPSGTGLTVTLQAANPGLNATVVDDPTSGTTTTTFDWGPTGHASDATGPFNFFAAAFEFKKDVLIQYLGDSTTPIAGANFYLSSTGLSCTLPRDDLIRLCGEPVTSYFSVREVPEPSVAWLVALGGGLVIARKVASRRTCLP